MVLASERLLLRPIEPDDVPTLINLWTNPDVTRYMGGPREEYFLSKHFEADLANVEPPIYDQWPVIEKSTDRLVGYCGLLNKRVEGKTEIELVFVFHPSAWGKGYATEIGEVLKRHAFKQLGLSRLIALIHPKNEPSKQVAIRLGMRFRQKTKRPGGKVVQLYQVDAE